MNKEKLINIATIIGAVTAVLGAVSAVLLPYLESYIIEVQLENMHSPQYKHESKYLIDEFLNSAEFQLIADELIKSHDIHQQKDNFRQDLATKMNVDLDEVHIELGRMYSRFKSGFFDKEGHQPQRDTTE